MAKPQRGLPADFSLDLPDESPVVIGDFLDEAPPPVLTRRNAGRIQSEPPPERSIAAPPFQPVFVRERDVEVGEKAVARPVLRPAARQPSVIRYQLNLTPKSKANFEEVVEYVRTFSPQADARTSEVFQGIMTLLHNAMDELDISQLPRRGAWGSVTAKNFPGALSEAFERAIVHAANKRGIR
jgi:hypothetical protein